MIIQSHLITIVLSDAGSLNIYILQHLLYYRSCIVYRINWWHRVENYTLPLMITEHKSPTGHVNSSVERSSWTISIPRNLKLFHPRYTVCRHLNIPGICYNFGSWTMTHSKNSVPSRQARNPSRTITSVPTECNDTRRTAWILRQSYEEVLEIAENQNLDRRSVEKCHPNPSWYDVMARLVPCDALWVPEWGRDWWIQTQLQPQCHLLWRRVLSSEKRLEWELLKTWGSTHYRCIILHPEPYKNCPNNDIFLREPRLRREQRVELVFVSKEDSPSSSKMLVA